MGLCLSSPKPAKKRAGSRTTKPLILNLVAAAAISEDSLPFAEPKSPRGVARPGTNTPFDVHSQAGKLAEAKKRERQANSGPGTNRSGHGSQPSSHEASKNAGTNRQDKRSTPGATSPRAPVIPPFQSAKDEAKHKAKAERHAKSGSGTNRSRHDSQPSSRNPTRNNSPESKPIGLGMGKNAERQNKPSTSDTTNPAPSAESISPPDKQSPSGDIKDSPQGKSTEAETAENAEVSDSHNEHSTSDTPNPALSAESISSPDKQSPSDDIKDSPQGKSTELGGTQTNIPPSTLPTQTLPPKSGNASPHTTDEHLNRKGANPNLDHK
ncbi:hypothetical protein M407DRAFT_25993 [Tulasnella calospora MUT 4182]|uniref:Uncharacterized protein n=1 Tax=Tulasnella calospora MUT 4182 TaxID=1051891 RepID=A0A0C3LTE5_9AGAM|nr:hypothetical protein M407DRAFT_25993 [Tulasnella calospora MUT 4182]